jgi:hypothetical protein
MRGSEGGAASGAWAASGDWSGANGHAMATEYPSSWGTAAPEGGQRTPHPERRATLETMPGGGTTRALLPGASDEMPLACGGVSG